MRFTDGTIQVATWATRQPGGFTPEQFTAIQAVITPLARVAEVRALRRTATNLLDTYVGRQAGERILAGKIQRGHIEEIYAAIWLSDMRGFTTLSEQLPSEDLIDLLNRYFGCQVPVILEHGGEVLKFMGMACSRSSRYLQMPATQTRSADERSRALAKSKLSSTALKYPLVPRRRMRSVLGWRFTWET